MEEIYDTLAAAKMGIEEKGQVRSERSVSEFS